MLLRKFSDCFHALVKATYDYMLNLASRRNAMYFLFAVAFIESSFFPIPPDVMLIPMVLAAPTKAWRIAGIATIASVLGGAFGYAIGVFFFDLIARPILTFYGYMHQFDVFKDYYHEWGAWIVFGAGITPFPYKVITIASGVVHLDFAVFMLASVVARGMRFYLVAWLLKKYGEPMKDYIEKNLGMLSVLFLLLLLGGFACIKLF
ncbi:MAG: YqaA family protein [Alphaproteobacteria bacterium]|jgi:dedA family protein|uniref:YqaA family protein n=1 Tax=Candidatus Scatocola faecigallinarum TaxID=2840916 RepID=UPI00033D2900|nr:dedA family protein [Azospirillum sp. CAG:239]